MRSFWRGTAWLSAIVSAIALLLYLFVFDTWVVPGDDPIFAVSVAPQLAPNDRILLRRGSVPRVGELARCRQADGRWVVGRVFGDAGSTVQIQNESVSVNGQGFGARHGCPPVTLVHPVSAQPIELTCAVEENPAWTYSVLRHRDYPEGDSMAQVPEGQLYLVSDNRALHQDSRDFGTVDATTCEHIVYRLWGDTFLDASRRFTLLW